MKQVPSGSRALCTLEAAREAPQRVLCDGRALVVWMVEEDRPGVIDDRCRMAMPGFPPVMCCMGGLSAHCICGHLARWVRAGPWWSDRSGGACAARL